GIPIVDSYEMLLIDEVSLIGSSAINNEKIEIIELCEKYGKHIMVDKPAVVNRDGLERLKAVIDRGQIQVGMMLTERFHPAIYTLKQYIEQGELGEIVSIAMRKPHQLNEATRPQWFFEKEQCGGILIDLLIHDFDLLTWFTGKAIQQTEGYVGKNILAEYPTFYNTVNLQVRMEDDVVMQLYADWHTADKSWTWGDGRIFVTGTKGFAELRLSGEPENEGSPMMLLVNDQAEWETVDLQQCPNTITDDFLERIQGNPSLLTHENILAASEAVINADEHVTYMVAPYKG
ncbi:MAG TPA: Gfo/Idh/MocA family oxidoreductase, partial [Candidatus Paenibacillus intestinavium]|nr:Gfo/Idh/MocA family oxidoreductase [Candidatus Paenibacillus intestinavium]